MLAILVVVFYPFRSLILDNTEGENVSVGSQELPVASVAATPSAPYQPEIRTVTFSAVGDNLIHDGIYLQAQRRAGGTGYDFAPIYENMKYFLDGYDVNWINQETLVNNELPAATYPCFSTPGELGQAAYDAGWRVFSIANNHTYDFGAKGISATRAFWSAMPEDALTAGLYTNDDETEIVFQEKNGMRLAYLSYTELTNGIPTPQNAEAHIVYTSQRDVIERQVTAARQQADVVIVSVHWGVEGSHTVTDAQRQLAADLANWGADVVIGTHPHVIQSVEWVPATDGRNVLVAYSLGNFISAQAQAKNMLGMALTFTLRQQVDADGTKTPATVENVKIYPTVTHYDAGYANIRNYMYRDYTDELAAGHGVKARESGFSRNYMQGLLQQYIAPEFLVLD